MCSNSGTQLGRVKLKVGGAIAEGPGKYCPARSTTDGGHLLLQIKVDWKALADWKALTDWKVLTYCKVLTDLKVLTDRKVLADWKAQTGQHYEH